MLLRILISCLTLVLASCHARWNNDYSTVAVECQVSREEAQKHFLQVLNEKGESLSTDQKAFLVAEFLPHQGERQRPLITPGGCVEIPDGSGEVAVVESKSKAALYWKTSESHEHFFISALIKKTSVHLRVCLSGRKSLCEYPAQTRLEYHDRWVPPKYPFEGAGAECL